jgi:hypothetical protein
MKNSLLKTITVILVGFFVAWGILVAFIDPETESIVRNLFSYTYGIIALWGGLIGLSISKKWGGFKSIVGRAIMMFSLGLLAQELGQATYSIYDAFLSVEIPYPSIGDVGWFLTIPFYFYGAWLLGKAAGTKNSLKTVEGKLLAVGIPGAMLTLTYLVFLKEYQFDWSNPLVILFDFGYPLGHALYISMAILAYFLSRRFLGGVMKGTILLVLFAMALQYLGDFIFLYQVITETFYWGGLYDYLFLASYAIMTIALIKFNVIYDANRHTE